MKQMDADKNMQNDEVDGNMNPEENAESQKSSER
jgi:hypothetical protein